MNLSFNEKDHKKYYTTILHMVGHALGLYHIHQNPYVDLQFDRADILTAFGYEWRNQLILENILKQPKYEKKLFGNTIDRDSIMGYKLGKEYFLKPLELK